jgi:hypothetical protein
MGQKGNYEILLAIKHVTCNYGVPRRSVLVFYFSLYVSNFTKLKRGKAILFTDTSILNMGINPKELKIARSTNISHINTVL